MLLKILNMLEENMFGYMYTIQPEEAGTLFF